LIKNFSNDTQNGEVEMRTDPLAAAACNMLPPRPPMHIHTHIRGLIFNITLYGTLPQVSD